MFDFLWGLMMPAGDCCGPTKPSFPQRAALVEAGVVAWLSQAGLLAGQRAGWSGQEGLGAGVGGGRLES